MSNFYKDKNLNCTMEQWEKVAWSYGKLSPANHAVFTLKQTIY